MFSIFGATGQALYNLADDRMTESAELTHDLKPTSWMSSKWSPMKVLSDREYETMLREKLLSVTAQIALVDESIEVLEKKVGEEEALRAESLKSD